jgi:membrane-associated phospholipid phosphatase
MKKNRYILVGIIFLLLFYGFSVWVNKGGFRSIDFDTTVKIQERIDTSSRLRLASFVGNVMEGSTFFASPEISIVAVGLLTLFALVDFRNKKIRLRALLIPLLFTLLVIGEIYGKNVVHHPAPPFFMIKNPTSLFPKYYINEQYSYPSGHTARAVFLGITFYSLFMIHNSLFKKRKLKYSIAIGIACYIFLVSISHIYLGHHWFSDVIGGGLLGTGLGCMMLSEKATIL